MLEILISIVSSFVYDQSKSIFGKIFEKDIFEQIEQAYQKSTKKWNKIQKEKYNTCNEPKLENAIKRITNSNIKNYIDEDLTEFLELFKEELISKHNKAWEYINSLKTDKIIELLNNTDQTNKHLLKVLSNLVDSINNLQRNPFPKEKSLDNWKSQKCISIDQDLLYNLISFDKIDIENKTMNFLFSSFINHKSWDTEIREIILKLQEINYDFNNEVLNELVIQLNSINLKREYKFILSDLYNVFIKKKPASYINQIIEKSNKKFDNQRYINDISFQINKLNSKLTNARFSKCFNIYGATGSGKTHFINYILRDNLYLPIFISIINENQTFSEILINKFIELTRIDLDIKRISDLFLLIHNNFIHNKIIIILEDIECVNEDTFREINNVLNVSTLFHNIYWIFSVNENFLDIVDNLDNVFASVYNFRGSIDSEIAEYKGWVNLDYINKTQEIPLQIITMNYEKDLDLDTIKYIKDILSKTNNSITPFYALLICEIFHNNSDSNIIHLVNIDLIDKLDEIFRYKNDSKLSDYTITQTHIFFITRLLITEFKTEFNSVWLHNQVKSLAINESDLQDDKIAKNSRRNLLKLGLLNKNLQNPNRIILNILNYWQYKIAETIFIYRDINKISILETFYCENRAESNLSFAENVCEYFFLFNQGKINYLSSLINSDLTQSPVLNKLPKSSFWFSIPKMRPENQEMFIPILKDKSFNKYDNRHDLYAYIQCVSRIDTVDYSIIERLDEINNIVEDVKLYDLINVCLYAIKRIIYNTQSIALLFNAATKLKNIEILEIQEEIASYLIKRSMSLSDIHNNVKYILGYLYIIDYEGLISTTEKKRWKRFFLREWIIFYFCIDVSKRLKLSSYDFFKHHGFYLGNESKLNKSISRELEREANISIGYLSIIKQEYNENFCSFFDNLLKNGTHLDRENCFHIIRHTVKTDGHNKIKVEKNFKPFLQTIYKDKSMGHIKEKYAEFFNHNI